jgi:hypothetical protein
VQPGANNHSSAVTTHSEVLRSKLICSPSLERGFETALEGVLPVLVDDVERNVLVRWASAKFNLHQVWVPFDSMQSV